MRAFSISVRLGSAVLAVSSRNATVVDSDVGREADGPLSNDVARVGLNGVAADPLLPRRSSEMDQRFFFVGEEEPSLGSGSGEETIGGVGPS